MTSLLFENPVRWVVLSVGALVVAAAIARVRPTRRTGRAVLVVAAAGLAGLVLQLTVQTARERLIAVCIEMAGDVERGDLDRLADRLDASLTAEGMDRERFLDAARRTLTHYHPEEPRLARFEVTLAAEDRAVVVFDATCRVVTSSQVLDRILTRWRLGFIQDGDEWRVRRIEMLPTPNSPLSKLSDVLP
ncbi:MAG: hypothetical protein FLDDKLPJ_03081 [Phycisphaerae bacterium]|nr:hypothetical protein [Phycisphaerae bacterium]